MLGTFLPKEMTDYLDVGWKSIIVRNENDVTQSNATVSVHEMTKCYRLNDSVNDT